MRRDSDTGGGSMLLRLLMLAGMLSAFLPILAESPIPPPPSPARRQPFPRRGRLRCPDPSLVQRECFLAARETLPHWEAGAPASAMMNGILHKAMTTSAQAARRTLAR